MYALGDVRFELEGVYVRPLEEIVDANADKQTNSAVDNNFFAFITSSVHKLEENVNIAVEKY